jgi:hypothetical protein
LIVIAILAATVSPFAYSVPAAPEQPFAVRKMRRVELYFGFDRSGRTPVSEQEWQEFLKEEVTPRFPDGFTVVEAAGQYRKTDGSVVRERSMIVIFLFPASERRKSGASIEEIRAAYKRKFEQESVLRLDFVRSVEADF